MHLTHKQRDLMIVGFMLRGAVSRIKSKFDPAPTPPADGSRVQDFLSRERVTLHMKIGKVQSSGFE